MSETTYYETNRKTMSNRVREYYENNKDVLRDNSRNKYRELSDEEKK